MSASPDGLTGSPASWREASCRPFPGTGLLVRFSGVVVFVGDADDRAAPLVEVARALGVGGADGRQLVRRIAAEIAAADDPPSVVALAPAAEGLVALAFGRCRVEVDGDEVRAGDSLIWREQVFAWPVSEVTVSATDTGPDDQQLAMDLHEGVVACGGARVTPATAGAEGDGAAHASATAPPSDGDDATSHGQEPAIRPPVATPGERNLGSADDPFESVMLGALSESSEDLDKAEPLPILERPRDVPSSAPAVSQVRGVFCKNKHFNDPRVLFCAVCGINMVHQTPVLVDGARPPLGVLVLDDGSIFQLDAHYLLGRDPESDDLVRNGGFRAIALNDRSNLISRIHARLELRNWDVVLADNASTNGTFFAAPGSGEWHQLVRGAEHVLVPRTKIRLGDRILTYTSHRAD